MPVSGLFPIVVFPDMQDPNLPLKWKSKAFSKLEALSQEVLKKPLTNYFLEVLHEEKDNSPHGNAPDDPA